MVDYEEQARVRLIVQRLDKNRAIADFQEKREISLARKMSKGRVSRVATWDTNPAHSTNVTTDVAHRRGSDYVCPHTGVKVGGWL
jgi:hypothetical protein